MLILKLSWRSIWRNRRRTLITVAALAFALTLVVFFISFGDGVYAGMINQAVSLQAGHVTVEHRDYRDAPAADLTVKDAPALRERLAMIAGVRATKLLVLGQGVAKSGLGAEGIAVIGVEPSLERATSPLAKNLVAGSFLDDDDGNVVVIGETLATRLKVEIGKKLVLSTNNTRGELVEELVRVKGIFDTGAVELDGYLVETPLAFAQRLFELAPDEVTQVGLLVADPDERDRVLDEARALTPAPAAARPWEEVLPDLASYVKVDGGSNYVLQGILVFLSLFTIFNTILMSVLERTREFAVMLALGTPILRIRAQVVLESALIAVLGVGLGLGAGGLAGYALEVHGIDLAAIYPEGVAVSGVAISTRVYGLVTWELLTVLGLAVFGATMATSLVAVRHLSRIRAAQVLR